MEGYTVTRRLRHDSRAVSFDMPHNQLARGENKITERRTHLTFGMNGAGILERERVAEKLKLSPLPKQGEDMNKLKLMLIDWLCKDDAKKVIRLIIKRHLPTMYIAHKPMRPTKRTHGDAI